jgi:hypothetical protein
LSEDTHNQTLKRALEALWGICEAVTANASLGKDGPSDEVGIANHEPMFWQEDVFRWAMERCVYRDRCFGGIGALCADFAEWAISAKSVPCTLRTFRQLLEEAGLFVVDGLVYGLTLRQDIAVVQVAAKDER